ncbi:bifunctional 4-hydroxy-2-oxoglutarate aldolase/2-dehydro-3-deoxy-phosphogluconate aldolase [Calothrix sp. FACHB-1219]|uniref:bifunctional 4-hydroxy-2-oxoglutarate aldolase/2-dehydro-3-deoxy-phosphogluconate aldolase n=1 Tax=unclassified Calothrix TaxID=2619626 RepID=UPI0016839E4C|nr:MULTISPECIES: bifunctional 4-hydroxy-2-oxoglutarate aldolase/2-dehydro-3-deoxy-phosphogluconate aldolase [unclassified Calothrix]MBD2204646.1 bifunctional 4-hydroxy-2-oxoglutarate aldolase/2-dehydro-3-deoxy-phosphogluconate aldolase [Calothrix sp. FACHB-168]MBD2216842.1 bifunctional 4-hydroxy-2-oxoglutarate aldolase/2-dehydro-3-deoxy-phosphogluconate aldolase [Calothrix sp. FACHB-1219]
MSNLVWLSQLQQHRAIAVIRASKLELAKQMALTVASGGMQLIEITWNSDRAGQLISQLRQELPHCTIGTGTLFNVTQLKDAIASGAQFLFTPHVDLAMIKAAVAQDVPIIPGALSPTEIVTAWNYGASCVKVFPVEAMGGANYIKSLQGPLGEIPLIPTGGVNIDNAKEFLQAGAIAIGLSSQLFPKHLVTEGDWLVIGEKVQRLIQQLEYFRVKTETLS